MVWGLSRPPGGNERPIRRGRSPAPPERLQDASGRVSVWVGCPVPAEPVSPCHGLPERLGDRLVILFAALTGPVWQEKESDQVLAFRANLGPVPRSILMDSDLRYGTDQNGTDQSDAL